MHIKSKLRLEYDTHQDLCSMFIGHLTQKKLKLAHLLKALNVYLWAGSHTHKKIQIWQIPTNEGILFMFAIDISNYRWNFILQAPPSLNMLVFPNLFVESVIANVTNKWTRVEASYALLMPS